MAAWQTIAPELIFMFYMAAFLDCEGRAGRRSCGWMVLLRLCQRWRAVGLACRPVWMHMPSVLPRSLQKAFVDRCKGSGKAVKEMWIAERDEYKRMSRVVALKASVVHIQMWRTPDRLHGYRRPVPATNYLPKLRHVAFHAGPDIKNIDQALRLEYDRAVYHLPIYRWFTRVRKGVKTKDWEVHRIKSSSFTFDAERAEPLVHYPTIIMRWISLDCYQYLETITITNMGPSGIFLFHPPPPLVPNLTMPNVKSIKFFNCSRDALDSFMLRVNFPALKKTKWNGEPYEIRVENRRVIFRSLA
ncbi:hypothetical protein SISNIDRAFT_471553 [Sistotremastrum niveocremeum HHB9708]|uniref:F-box domain-containing protein n=1 Tax=Sistotremastrum niveocremeum HHB9708 TaxID=1314777 RepID=A0A164MGZ0_9AGAM|nr:hypothetical protein SISNIDRAFT_471553 [Sistotremastrum niveocremeum HHB9708]